MMTAFSNGAPVLRNGADRFARLFRSLAPHAQPGGGLWLVVTSVRSGEGVTAVARGLARAIADECDGCDTLYWRLAPEPSDAIVGAEIAPGRPGANPEDDPVRPHGEMGRLYVIPAPPVVVHGGDCSEDRDEIEVRLGNGGLAVDATTVRRLRDRFRFGVIDASPILSSSACLKLAGAVEGALLVVEANSTSWRSAQQAAGALRSGGLTPLGLVLNKARPELPSRWRRLFGEASA